MTLAQTILERLKEHLALPWPENVSARERVVMVVYPAFHRQFTKGSKCNPGNWQLKWANRE